MTIRIQKILLPTDFSKYSAAATRYACELATKFDAELHILHTLETHLVSTPDFGFGFDLPKYISESKAAAGKAVVEGSPKVEIIAYARKHNIDLATHGRTGLAHVLMGSVAESVVRTAPCSTDHTNTRHCTFWRGVVRDSDVRVEFRGSASAGEPAGTTSGPEPAWNHRRYASSSADSSS